MLHIGLGTPKFWGIELSENDKNCANPIIIIDSMIPEIARGVEIFSEGWLTSVMMISFLIQVLFRHMQVDIFYNKGE